MGGYVTCNIIFGAETLGTSLLWCGILIGAAGSFMGGKYLGGATQVGGDYLYETVIR